MSDTNILTPSSTGTSADESRQKFRSRPVARFGSRISSVIAAAVLIVVVLWIIAPGWFTNHNPLIGDYRAKLQPPSLQNYFGTDHLGRDVFARTVYGARQTALTAGAAVAGGAIIGAVIGLFAGTAGRLVDAIFMRLIDVITALPSFLVAVLVVTLLGRSQWSLALGVAFGSIALFARVMRAETLKVRNYDFVTVSTISGSSYWRTVTRRILPNAIGPVLALTVVELGFAILTISALGFIGFGAPPPTPEWGLIVAEGRNQLALAWWISSLPGLVICAVVLAFGNLGRMLRGDARHHD